VPHDREDERLRLHGLRTALSGEEDAWLDAPRRYGNKFSGSRPAGCRPGTSFQSRPRSEESLASVARASPDTGWAPPNMRLKLAAPSSQGRIAFVTTLSVRRSLGAVR